MKCILQNHGGEEAIKHHPFFRDVKWRDLEERRIKPPFKPKIVRFLLRPLISRLADCFFQKSKKEATNFDTEFTKEDPVLTPINQDIVRTINQVHLMLGCVEMIGDHFFIFRRSSLASASITQALENFCLTTQHQNGIERSGQVTHSPLCNCIKNYQHQIFTFHIFMQAKLFVPYILMHYCCITFIRNKIY